MAMDGCSDTYMRRGLGEDLILNAINRTLYLLHEVATIFSSKVALPEYPTRYLPSPRTQGTSRQYTSSLFTTITES